MTTLAARIASQARRFGPLPWSVFMEAGLYDPVHGFYQSGGAAGRRGDFVTSPEIGPLYAAVWARALDRWWDDLGQPDPYVVVEAAAGSGTLARDILATGPRCAGALRYILVERSSVLREAQVNRLPLELPAFVLGPSAPAGADSDDQATRQVPGSGPVVTSLPELPSLELTGAVVANELLDNLPFDLLEWCEGRWQEVRVGAADDNDDELVEVLVPASADVVSEAERLFDRQANGLARRDGARIPLQRAAGEWLRVALSIVEVGRVALVDYADSTAALANADPGSWLRTFRQHRAGLPPLKAPGTQDITSVVAVDQLALVRPPTNDRSQAEWLTLHGLDDLVGAARETWRERAGIGDLEALTARSRIHEAEALTDPEGLGAFRVLEWVVE